ncbi:hypothetical protein AAHC03_022521 [Spirometra sp. Aus1]
MRILVGRSCFLHSLRSSCFWKNVAAGAPDVIFGLNEAYDRDPNPKKVNLGAGAYRDDEGLPFVLSAVRTAEARVIIGQNKEYLPISGNPNFCREAIKLALGSESPVLLEKRNATVQGISGTGSLRIGAAFLEKFAPSRTIWLPTPTWGNHPPIFNHAGLNVKFYRYYNAETLGVDIFGLLEDLSQKIPDGDTVLFHACAHNPTGIDPSPEEWKEIASIFSSRPLIPFFDMAYQGFASGDVDRDAFALRHLVSSLLASKRDSPGTLLLAQSFAKNMGLYGERVGAFSLLTASEDADAPGRCMSQLKILIRGMYSNPPLHGARIATEILTDPDLKQTWLSELKGMADRLTRMRQSLKSHLERNGSARDWSHITKQIGMFCFTGLNPKQVARMKQEFSVYMTNDGRISIASLTPRNVDYVAQAIHEVTK